MRWLVNCEYSQIVTKAMRDAGHEAYSCDILPTEGNPEWHIQADAREVAYRGGWDGMVAHPPCTYFTLSGNRWLYEDCAATTAQERHKLRDEAIEFFLALKNAPIDKIAIENPKPHPYVIERVGMYQDFVQPYYFGDGESKGICLWLKNLPPLMSTIIDSDVKQSCWLESPGKDRAKNRSRFFHGVAKAMADQWN